MRLLIDGREVPIPEGVAPKVGAILKFAEEESWRKGRVVIAVKVNGVSIPYNEEPEWEEVPSFLVETIEVGTMPLNDLVAEVARDLPKRAREFISWLEGALSLLKEGDPSEGMRRLSKSLEFAEWILLASWAVGRWILREEVHRPVEHSLSRLMELVGGEEGEALRALEEEILPLLRRWAEVVEGALSRGGTKP